MKKTKQKKIDYPIKAIKIKMSQVFNNKENAVPITWLKCENPSIFKPGQIIKLSGKSKGKGFQGVVKRWGFKGAASASHGTKHTLRAPGAIGSAWPEKVFKGKKMAGHMGAKKTTIKTSIIKINKKNKQIAVKGAVPGANKSQIKIFNIKK